MKRQTHIILLLPLLFIFTGLAWGASNSNSTHLGYGHHYGHHGYMQSRNNVSDVADAIEKTSKSIEQINTKIAQLQQRINGHDVKIPATLGQLEQTLPAATKETEND